MLLIVVVLEMLRRGVILVPLIAAARAAVNALYELSHYCRVIVGVLSKGGWLARAKWQRM